MIGFMEDLWPEFKYSPECRALRQAVHLDSAAAHDEFPSLENWLEALKQGCNLYVMLAGDDADNGDDDSSHGSVSAEERWDFVCFLLQGTFSTLHSLPLQRLKQEPQDLFLLHAATNALPLCNKEFGGEQTTSNLRRVFQRVLKLHGNQLALPGPVLNRLPLHLAVCNKGSSSDAVKDNDDPPSRIDAPNTTPFRDEILETIVRESPAFAVSTPDASGKYPFHLACASGFSWVSGLELLYTAAPEVIPLFGDGVSSIFVLMSESAIGGGGDKAKKAKSTPHSKKKQHLVKWMRRKVWKNKTSYDRKQQRQMAKKAQDLEAVNTIFELLSTDPSALAI